MKSNEEGGVYRWADEEGPQEGCPTWTSSVWGEGENERVGESGGVKGGRRRRTPEL